MDVQGAPRRHLWQEVLLLVVVMAETAIEIIFAAGAAELWSAGLTLVLGAALLLRHRHWRWQIGRAHV